MVLHGRMMITTDETEVTMNNVLTILQKALPYHWKTALRLIISIGITGAYSPFSTARKR